jgi:hypothetical protein
MLGVWLGLHFRVGDLVMSKGESIIILLLLVLVWLGFQKEPEKVKEPLDNEPITVKMEGSWEQFGKLTFSDSVLTKDD